MDLVSGHFETQGVFTHDNPAGTYRQALDLMCAGVLKSRQVCTLSFLRFWSVAFDSDPGQYGICSFQV